MIVDPERRWTVYYHQNKVNGKIYVGITSQKPERRWQNGHGYDTQMFGNAVKKYGWDKGFYHAIFASDLTENEAKKMETTLIKLFKTYDKDYGYNLTSGGDGVVQPPRPVYQYDMDGNFVQYWDDVHKVVSRYNLDYDKIIEVCNGKRRKTGNWVFRFEPDHNIKACHTVNLEYPILQFSFDGKLVQRWDNISTAAKSSSPKKYHSTKIKECCNHDRISIYGYFWLYEYDYQNNPEYLDKLVIDYHNSTEYKLQNYTVEQYDTNDNLIGVYDNFWDMKNKLNINRHNMQNCLYCAEGKYKTIIGYKWKAYQKCQV